MQSISKNKATRLFENNENLYSERITEYTAYRQDCSAIDQRRLSANSEKIGFNYIQSFISNISFPKNLDELEYFAMKYGQFNVEDILCENAVIWTAPRWAKINDIVFFMHAKTAVSTITRLRSELNQKRSCLSDVKYNMLMEWISKGLALYKEYGGKIFAIGRVDGAPEYESHIMDDPDNYQMHWKSKVYAKINEINVLLNPIDISRFNDFIMVSRQSSITPVLGEAFDKLKDIIRESNSIPNYFEKSVSSAIPLGKITHDNWLSLPKEYRRRFVLEAQFRCFYVDFLLSELGDRKTILKECRCIKAGVPDSFVDNLIFMNGKYLPVEVKLSVSAQQNLKSQVLKYCYDDMITTKSKTLFPNNLYSNRVLIIDTESLFVYDAKHDSLEKIFELDGLTNKASIHTLKTKILQKL